MAGRKVIYLNVTEKTLLGIKKQNASKGGKKMLKKPLKGTTIKNQNIIQFELRHFLNDLMKSV